MIPARFGQKFVNKQEKKRPSIQKRRILDRTSGEKGGECALRPSRGSEGLEGAQGNHKAPSGSSEASKGMGTPPEYNRIAQVQRSLRMQAEMAHSPSQGLHMFSLALRTTRHENPRPICDGGAESSARKKLFYVREPRYRERVQSPFRRKHTPIDTPRLSLLFPCTRVASVSM